jgi:cytochrome P450
MLAEVGDNLFAPQVLEDPYSYYGQLREHDPVHWNDDYQTWVITRYADVSWMSRHPDVFSSGTRNEIGTLPRRRSLSTTGRTSTR